MKMVDLLKILLVATTIIGSLLYFLMCIKTSKLIGYVENKIWKAKRIYRNLYELFYKYFISTNKTLNIIIAASFILFIFNELIVYSFYGSEHVPRTLEISNKFLISIISSYFFYIIVIRIKEIKDAENVRLYIQGTLSEIHGSYNSLISPLTGPYSSDEEMEERFPGVYMDKRSLKDILKKTNPNDSLNFIVNDKFENINHHESFIYHKAKVDYAIKKLFNVAPFLDTKIIEFISRLENSIFLHMIDFHKKIMEKGKDVKNENMLMFLDAMYDYSMLIKEIEEYNLKK